MDKEKKCSRCGLLQNINDFYNDKRRKDGHQSECKLCHRDEMNKWRETHAQEHKAMKREWQKNHLNRAVVAAQKYRDTHPEYLMLKHKWRKNNPDKVKLMDAKQNAIRKREFGFIPLNQPTKGTVGHHIDRDHVIYIPLEVHKSIPHSVTRNKNMEAINAIAFGLLREVVKTDD